MQQSNTQLPTKPPPLHQDKNLLIVFALSVMAVLGVSSVTPAFPKIIQTFNIPPARVGLLISLYTLPTLLFSPGLGILADRLGRKQVAIPSLILAGIAGTACAFTDNFNQLLGWRFLQGMGVASLRVLPVAIIGDLYTGVKRTTAIGYQISVSSIATTLYPILGGALAVMSWSYPFLLNLSAFPVALLVWLALKNPEPNSQSNTATTFKAHSINALKRLRNAQFIGLFVVSMVDYMLLFGVHQTYLPLFIDQSFQASSFQIGLILASVPIAIVMTSLQTGRLAQRFSEISLIQVALICHAVALCSISFIPYLWLLLIPSVLLGMGLGLSFPSIAALLSAQAPQGYLATILSANDTFGGLGRTLGPLLMGTIFGLGGIDAVFYGGAGMAIVSLVFLRACPIVSIEDSKD